MILNSNLYGISHKDIVLAAYVTDVNNREEVNVTDWAKYNGILQPEDVEAVKKLSVILRLATALDYSMRGVVKEINCDVLGDSVIMKMELEGDATLEKKAASLVTLDFKKVFRKNLEMF